MGLAFLSLGITRAKAFAQSPSKTNIQEITCRTLLKMDGDEEEFTLIFFHGFMSGRNNQLIVDAPDLTKTTDRILDYCINNPNASLLKAFELYRPSRRGNKTNK